MEFAVAQPEGGQHFDAEMPSLRASDPARWDHQAFRIAGQFPCVDGMTFPWKFKLC
jgi:hypothetical protein